MLVISHELRNPLQVILGQAQLMSVKMTPEMRAVMGSNLESLIAQARLLSTLIDDLLNAYRVGNGRFSVNLTAMDLRAHLLSLSRDGWTWTVFGVFSRRAEVLVMQIRPPQPGDNESDQLREVHSAGGTSVESPR